MAPAGTGAVLIIEVDGTRDSAHEEAARVEDACREAGATEILRARDEAGRQELWRVRRELSHSLRMVAALKFNHDVVVPKGRDPGAVRARRADQVSLQAAHSVLRTCGRRQHPREHHGVARRS